MKKFFSILLVTVFCALTLAACSDVQGSKAAKKLTNISIEATLDGTVIDVKQKTNFINSSDNVMNEVAFNVYANAYNMANCPVSNALESEAFPNGKSYGNAAFDSIKIGGNSAGHQLKNNGLILAVALSTPLYPNARVEIETNFVVTLANIRHLLGFADDVFSLAHFYLAPCALEGDGTQIQNSYTQFGDPFVFDCANYSVKFTAPEDFIFAATGSVKNTKSSANGKQTHLIEASAVRDFAIVGSTSYKTAKKGGISFCYLDDENPGEIVEIAADAFKFFEDKFGKLPSQNLSIVEAPLMFGGMEYSGVAVVSLSARSQRETYKEVVVHEIAHQWWFSLVGNNQFDEAWVDEALAEFSTLLFMTNNPKNLRTAVAKRLDKLMAFCDATAGGSDALSLKINRPLSEFKNSNEYANVVYYQGSIMLYCLYEIMGESRFVGALQDYVKNNRFKIATSADLIAAFEKKARTRLESFFEQWLEGNINLSEL